MDRPRRDTARPVTRVAGSARELSAPHGCPARIIASHLSLPPAHESVRQAQSDLEQGRKVGVHEVTAQIGEGSPPPLEAFVIGRLELLSDLARLCRVAALFGQQVSAIGADDSNAT